MTRAISILARTRSQHLSVVHHVAFRVADDAAQAAWRGHLEEAGRSPSPVRDRNYFHSICFREPGGVLFELATDPPGFAVDEPLASLGSELKPPPSLEPWRERIEPVLPPLEPSPHPRQGARLSGRDGMHSPDDVRVAGALEGATERSRCSTGAGRAPRTSCRSAWAWSLARSASWATPASRWWWRPTSAGRQLVSAELSLGQRSPRPSRPRQRAARARHRSLAGLHDSGDRPLEAGRFYLVVEVEGEAPVPYVPGELERR